MRRARSVAKAVNTEYEGYMALEASRYLGEWVAIFHGKVIAHGKSPKNVSEEASRITENQLFMITKISSGANELL